MQVQLTQDREIGSISAAARPGRVKQFKKHWLFVTLLYLAITLAFQHLTGVYQSEFGHHPDEAAHVVTSLMIRDYLASGFHGNPLRYAENYYVHYPKVAFGMWPPGFHIASAMWMLIFPPTRTTLLCFMALQTTILAVSLGIFAGRLFGDLAGAALGLLLLCLPLIQWGTSIVMLDMCVALFQFSAMCFAVRYFKTERVRWAVLFGICSAGAMLTKGTANGVVLVPVVMLLLTRRFSILRKPGLYIAASIIFVLGLPWQLISWRLYQSTIPIAHVDTIYMWTRFTLYIVMLVQKLSTPLCVLALLGLLVQCWKLLRLPSVSLADGDIRLAGTISLLIGITVLHIVAPISAPDFRYTIPALPAILILFAAGVRWVAERIPARVQQATKNSVIAGIALVIFASTTFAIPVRATTKDRCMVPHTSSCRFNVTKLRPPFTIRAPPS